MCGFEKLKGKYGLDALVSMDEDGVIPPGFPETAVAVARECSSGAGKDASSGLVDVGSRAEPVSIEDSSARHPDADPRKTDASPEEAYCMETAAKLQAAGEQVVCDGTSIVNTNKAAKHADDAGQAPAELGTAGVKKMYFDELVNGKPCCGHAAQEDLLLSLIGEDVEKSGPSDIQWTTQELLQLSSDGVRAVYPDTEQGPPMPEAVAFREKFCSLHRQQLEATDDMQLCMLGVYGE